MGYITFDAALKKAVVHVRRAVDIVELVTQNLTFRFFFWPVVTSFTYSFTSARMLGETIQDRGPLETRMPSAGQQ